MTLHTIRGAEWLSLVGLNQVGRGGVVAIEAKRRRGLGQMVVVLNLALLASLVGYVTGLAAHIEGCMPAAFVRNVHPLGMALEAQVLALISGVSFDQLVLVVGLMRVMALDAVPDCGRMYGSLQISGVFVGMAGNTNRRRTGGDQLYAGNVLANPDLVTARATHCDGGVNELAFGFVFVALDAFGRIRVLVQGNWMDGRHYNARAECESHHQN